MCINSNAQHTIKVKISITCLVYMCVEVVLLFPNILMVIQAIKSRNL